MTEDTAGKTVVITGAASGIGRALALGFLADGAKVVAADIAEAGLVDAAKAGAETVVTDVTDAAAVQRLIDQAVRLTGGVHVLFNNAGVAGGGRIEAMAPGAFEQVIAVHLFGALYGLRAALPVMRAQGYGRIINTLSRGAESKAAGWSSYGSAKAAMLTLTRVAAAEAADGGADILVNGMIPGPTLSGMMKGEGLQAPEAVYPGARWLATLPTDGPTGQVFWNMKPYTLFKERTAA